MVRYLDPKIAKSIDDALEAKLGKFLGVEPDKRNGTRYFKEGDKVTVIGKSHFIGKKGIAETVGNLTCCVVLKGDNVSTIFYHNELEKQ